LKITIEYKKMNLKRVLKYSFIFLLAGISCTKTNCPEDLANFDAKAINSFHKSFFAKDSERKSGNFSIYLDYSSGMKIAFEKKENTDFYFLFINSLKISEPDFYAVESDAIKKIESSTKSELYKRIKDIKSYNKINAPLDIAIQQIVAKNTESVFITDGELWKNEERDDPWAREEFGKWLKKGNTIEIYATDFVEKGKQKHVFYLFFIPKEIVNSKNNVASEFRFYLDKSLEAKNLNYTKFSFSNSGYKLVQEYSNLNQAGVNENAEFAAETYINAGETSNFEYIELFLPWRDMHEYIGKAYNEKTGKEIKGGEALLSNIFLEINNLEYYKIEEIGIKVYDIRSEFLTFSDCIRCARGEKPSFELDENGNKLLDEENLPVLKSFGEEGCYDETGKLIKDTVFRINKNLKEIKNLLVLDQQAFENNFDHEGRGEIMIKLFPELNEEVLNTDCGNFHRIDVYLKKVSTQVASPSLEKFIWDGIQLQKNRSIYNSIIGAINDANPEGTVIYTFYLRTPSLE